MEISDVVNTQIVFPGLIVGLVLICAMLVFVFGFKTVEDFPFNKLATVADDRKPAGKKRKVKDKKSQPNGQATVVSDTKQKSSESPNIKTTTAKSSVNEVSSKPEPSPAKTALKDTKNIKETSEYAQKQGKPKESIRKQQKDQHLNKQTKSKGKENVEVKNKKNTEKSKNKAEEKPKDFDEGEWEQAFSRKEKKNRKPAASDEENIVEKLVKTEATSPGKKKKVKPVAEPTPAELTPAEPTPAVPVLVKEIMPEIAPVSTKDKAPKKEKEQKKEKPKKLEEPQVLESVSTTVESEGECKTSKKKKKKSASKEVADIVPQREEGLDCQEPLPDTWKPVETTATEESQVENSAVFDELGENWKEAKTQKKGNKKKVRKAE